tara:strand:+ start:3619 stop:4104 length:486 start_codon:yes stop_codon:yes gene_type:complete
MSEILSSLTKKFPDSITSTKVQRKTRLWVTVKFDVLIDVCKYLKNEQDFNHLSSVVGVDYKDKFEVVYHLWSYSKKIQLSLKVPLEKKNPKVKTVTKIWRSANWHERETAELFGIIFEEHPYPKHLLLADDFEGYPLRKDFKLVEKPWYDKNDASEKQKTD